MAAAATTTYEDIRKSIKARNLAPVYLLHGEEGYYIDELLKEFMEVLPADDREFNQYVLHASEVTPRQVTALCSQVPMMAERQVVILKEAQTMRADQLKQFAAYFANPIPTTLLIVAVRGAQAKGKELFEALRKGGGIAFESRKIADYNAPALIGQIIKAKGLSADQKALQMLCDYVGTDLSRLYNEIDKLATLLPPGGAVTPEVIERNIGISREYNSFELVDALATKNAVKAFRILAYFRSNPKAAPVVMITAAIFNFFADLLTAYYSTDSSDSGIMNALGLRNSFALRRIRSGMAAYSPVKIVEIISAIRRFDAMSKGVGSRQNEQQLLYDLVYHILTAPGRL